jgi:aspartate oxidase
MFSNMPSAQSPASFTPTAPVQADNRMVTSLVQTLDKLNKHLDAASMTAGGAGRRPSSSSVISALVSASEAAVQNSSSTAQRPSLQHASSVDVEAIKAELRQEMQAELRSATERNAAIEEKLDSLQRTQEVILNMLRQDPA